MRHWAFVIAALAVVSFAIDARGAECRATGERHDGNWNTDRNIGTLSVSQEFKPQLNYTLCAVSVNLECQSACTVDVKIQSGPEDWAQVLTQTSLPLPASSWHLWYEFDFPDKAIKENQSVWIRVEDSSGTCNCQWSSYFESGGDPYPRGDQWIDGTTNTDEDSLFVTWRLQGSGYLASLSNTVSFDADAAIAANMTRQFTVQLPASIVLEKAGTQATVNVQSATIDVDIGPNVGGFSDFTLSSGTGQFQAYTFGGTSIPVSDVTAVSGTGSIEWATGDITLQGDVVVEAAGFSDIVAHVYGSARLVNADTVTVDLDSMGVEPLPPMVPSIGVPGLSVLVAGMLLVGVALARRLRRSSE
jgi:hypothetical protein